MTTETDGTMSDTIRKLEEERDNSGESLRYTDLHTVKRFIFRLEERINALKWANGERSCWTCPFFYDEIARACRYPGEHYDSEPYLDEEHDAPDWCPLNVVGR